MHRKNNIFLIFLKCLLDIDLKLNHLVKGQTSILRPVPLFCNAGRACGAVFVTGGAIASYNEL